MVVQCDGIVVVVVSKHDGDEEESLCDDWRSGGVDGWERIVVYGLFTCRLKTGSAR